MGKWQWASQFHLPTNTIASTSAVGFGPARATILDKHPLQRTWRSTVTIEQDIVLDLGSSKTSVAFAVMHVNMATVQLATSADGVTYSFLTGSPFTVTQDIDGFYKLFVAQTRTHRYLLLRMPAQTTITGASYFEVGMVMCVATLNTLPRSPLVDMTETVVRPYLRSGDEVAPVGMNYLTQEWQLIETPANSVQFRQIALLGQHTPILVYRNAGLNREVALFRYTNDIQARLGGTTVSINPMMRQMV